MSQQIDAASSEMDILGGDKNNPPHTQQSQMATEFTSSAMIENTKSKITPSLSTAAINIVALPVDGVTDSSGPHDEIMSSLSSSCPNNSSTSVTTIGGQQSRNKRKHRRGKPKMKNTKPYKKSNWKFQVPRYGAGGGGGGGGFGGGGGGGGSGGHSGHGGNSSSNSNSGRRIKLNRSRSLVPYNTNKFLMEEHLAEVPSALLTPSGRTRDSSFSVDSEDNYFYSLPEDEEEFLTKEFANVYEKARVERLETLTKQQLIEECLQIEDRYSEQGAQRQQQINVQKITAEYLSKIRQLDEKVRDLTRENYEMRRQLAITSATASAITQHPTPMDSSSEDSESDSSSSSSKSSSSESSLSEYSACDEQKQDTHMIIDPSASAEEQEDVANGVARCNGYHSAGSITPPSSPSRSLSPASQQRLASSFSATTSNTTQPQRRQST